MNAAEKPGLALGLAKSIATVSISGSLPAKLEAASAAGFDGVEIFENDLLTFDGTPADVRRIAADLGLAITMFQPFRDFEGMPGTLRTRTFERMQRKFDVMAELGTDLLLVCSNVSPQSLSERGRIVDDFRELGDLAAARGLRVGYEALAWGRHVHDHRDAWDIVHRANHPNIGLILDSFHSLARNVPTDSIRDIDPAKLFIVQIADAPRLDMDHLYWSRHFRNMPGQGDLPITDYVRALLAIGYKGPLSLEIFNDRFRAGSASGIALDGYRSLKLVEDEALARLKRPAAMKPRVGVTGVEFIEFAATEEEAGPLGAMLSAMGFEPVGRHVTKAVTRWRQGGINIVLNCETEGFAHSHSIVHGASVCALALRVTDVPAALDRARELHIPRFAQAVGPGEKDIPSVRGVGGSLVYFIEDGTQEQVWRNDFVPLEQFSMDWKTASAATAAAPLRSGLSQAADAAPAPEEREGCAPVPGAGLTRIDHIAQAMGYEEFLSWLLYYFALFDVTKTPQLEIADPLGIVHSQAIENEDRSFRVTLNGSAAAQTLTSRFLNHYLGAGVQHVALATDDIFATAKALRERGLERLPIPRNYYDDIEARFALDPELVERLAAHDILYDRSEDCEFFQLYSRAFAKRFFFEFVERRGYDAYGAANAAVRLAAQSRFNTDTVY
ncbi:bifunctional sugar phosphate isomerase/epimerase/4-hydroxyphenylpyruvate dioxygenase family protein [Niveispirillum sp. KHB5.9]|uniref:bifunctional sugar phosphate isomerase/epimerase/4-hydroxyphenylpyruvate dioxygenase family protein n=1 Tax=Niveispirillum sp. KHB5.9 TaxID=3400269 RepID=UPI003A88D31C